MSSSDRDTNEASLKKMIKWYVQQFWGGVVEISKSQRLGSKDLIIVNSVRSPSEMQTGPCYCHRPIIIPETQKFISKVTVYIH